MADSLFPERSRKAISPEDLSIECHLFVSPFIRKGNENDHRDRPIMSIGAGVTPHLTCRQEAIVAEVPVVNV
jgi:hypothetical protein